ncbi:MAG TPA: hypothetical protein VHI13_15070 [Candidatus Kapabacteria bacterium]|nr:hypothetical protein [Candidatus Kapabacteria bacterium]
MMRGIAPRGFALLPVLLLLAALSPAVRAQQRGDAESIGMGKASVATSRGLSALYANPGALGLEHMGLYDSIQQVEVDLALLPMGAVAGSTYLDPSSLNFVFDKKDRGIFTDEDRLRLASLIEEGRLSADAEVDAFALRIRAPGIGAIGIRYGHRVRAQMNFPENFRTGVLGSGDVFARDQRFDSPEIGGDWTRNLTVTLASAWERPIDPGETSAWFPAFGVGYSLAYVEGIVHFDVDQSSWASAHVIQSPLGETYRSIEVRGAYTFRSSTPADSQFKASDAILNSGLFGSKTVTSIGWEGGLGMSVVILRKMTAATVSITGDPLNPQQMSHEDRSKRDALVFGVALDGVGTINWNGANRLRSYPDIRDTLTDQNGGISNDVIYRYTAKLDTIGAFATVLPMTLRVGLGADVTAFVPGIPGDLIASVETAFDMNHQIGGERATRCSLGAEWRPTSFFVLRSGMQLGGRLGAAMALGVGLRPFSWLSLDVATSEVTSLFFADRRRVDGAFTLGTHFRL